MLPENIFKEILREDERNKRGRKDRKEEKRERSAKRRRETLEQQPRRLEQGILRCPRRGGARDSARAGARRARARASTAVCRGHCRAIPTPCTQVPRRRRRAHGASAGPREHLADAQPVQQDHQEVPLQVPGGA